jgi:hypothetical protein
MSIVQHQEKFAQLVTAKLSEKELAWLNQKTAILKAADTIQKFPIFFSLTSRFISNEISNWESDELNEMEIIYPGFSKSTWTKQELVRVILMISLDPEKNKQILESFYETAEMLELVSFFKGLYLLKNASEFTSSVEEGIRTNMVNVFDSFTAGNPYAQKYLEEWAWNQLVLKALFMDRPLFTIHDLDKGKNKNLADILQDYIRERWSAFRPVSPEIWRMIQGNLREDIKELLKDREIKSIEKTAIEFVLNNNEHDEEFWNEIGKQNLNK